MSEDKYAVSTAWEKSNEFKRPFDYVLKETGQTCLVRRMDMGDFLKLGVAEELDFMSKALMTDDTQQKATEAVSSAMMKSENFSKMERMINLVVLEGVVKPKLQKTPEHDAARQPGQLYIDAVPFSDRLELFSVIFDSEGLSTFREEQEDGVGNVADEPSVSLPTDEPVAVRSDNPEGVLLQ
jgi:hypothetical protein